MDDTGIAPQCKPIRLGKDQSLISLAMLETGSALWIGKLLPPFATANTLTNIKDTFNLHKKLYKHILVHKFATGGDVTKFLFQIINLNYYKILHSLPQNSEQDLFYHLFYKVN